MSLNNRILYSCQAVKITNSGHITAQQGMVHGLQSVGMTTSFNLSKLLNLVRLRFMRTLKVLQTSK